MMLEQGPITSTQTPRPTIGSILLKTPSPNKKINYPEQGWTITPANVTQFFQQRAENQARIFPPYKWLTQNALMVLAPIILQLPAHEQQTAATNALKLASELTFLPFGIAHEIIFDPANFTKRVARKRIKQSLMYSKIRGAEETPNYSAPDYAKNLARTMKSLMESAVRNHIELPPETLGLLDPLGLYEASQNDPELKAKVPDIFERNAAYLIRTILRHLSGKSLYSATNKYFETVKTSKGTYHVPISMAEEQIRKEQRNRLAIV